jgi:hypothetical protein
MIVIERFVPKTSVEILLVERAELQVAKINSVFLLSGA